MLTPPDPISGPAASTAAYERLRQFAIANSLTSGNGGGGLRKAFGGGTVFAYPEKRRARPSLGSATTHPFLLSDGSVGSTLKVRIKFGMVNSLTPTGMGGTDPDLLLTVTATKYVVLEVTTVADGIATSAAISLQTTVAADTATSAKQALGLVTYTAAAGAVPASIAFSQVVAGSLRHQRCGGAQHLFGGV